MIVSASSTVAIGLFHGFDMSHKVVKSIDTFSIHVSNDTISVFASIESTDVTKNRSTIRFFNSRLCIY